MPSSFNPTLSTFDPDRGADFKGEFLVFEVRDPALPTHQPNLVIDPSQPFDIQLEWRLAGNDVALYIAALGGNWDIEVFAESIGPGPDLRIAADNTVPAAPAANLRDYKKTLTVAANTLPEGNPGAGNPSGVFRLVATVFLNAGLGAPGKDIVGFAEGPIIMVEDPV
ncbi:MAG: hypothetical protein ACREEM_08740 [Blastocatellia bacterium]